LQVKRVEAFGEPAIDWSEKIAGLVPFAPIAPQPRHARRRAQFPRFCLLLTRDRERALEIRLRFDRVWLWRFERDFAGHAMDFGLAPPLLRCFHRAHRITNTAPGIVELTEFCISFRQI